MMTGDLRFDTSTIYQNVTLLNSGVFDTVRVTLRRDGIINDRFPLFFAQILGVQDAGVTVSATAVLQKPRRLIAGSGVLPFAVPLNEWTNDVEEGETWTIYGDGKMVDADGNTVPGNWGTLDIGSSANSTADLSDQIRTGLHQSHIDALHADGRIPTDTHIDTNVPVWLNADTGISVGLKHAVEDIWGQSRVIPLFDAVNDNGGNGFEYRVVRWGVATVDSSKFAGQNRYVKITKACLFSGMLRPVSDLGVDSTIEGAFTSPVLVE